MVDILFILLLALLIVGPKKLPQIARQLGGFVAQFKQVQNDFKRQLDAEVLKVQMHKTTARDEMPTTVSRTGGERFAALDPSVTNSRSAEVSPTSPLG